jgi:DNA-directed RNA polymerase subunit RPC12/RpoP
MFKCEICGNTFKIKDTLLHHFQKYHSISIEEYYLKYILKQNEPPKCSIESCSHNAHFVSFFTGFDDRCNDIDCSLSRPKVLPYKCKICGKEFKGKGSLLNHLISEHNIHSKEEYYLKHISKVENENICSIEGCCNETKFISEHKGFTDKCSDIDCILGKRPQILEYKCQICGEEFNSFMSFSKHLIKHKNVTQEDYYLKYIQVDTEIPKCPICGKNRVFNKLSVGYNPSCGNKSCYTTIKNNTAKRTNNIKYGCDYPMQTKEFQDCVKKSNMAKYGVTCTLQVEEVKVKIKGTNKLLYGNENPFHSEIIKQRIIDTNIKKYGCENVFQNEEIINKMKDKTRQTLEEKGVWIPLDQKSDWELYKRQVWKCTRHCDELVEGIEKRKRNEFSLDHKYSVKQGFLDGILPCIIGSIHNLEILPEKENIIKRTNCSITLEELTKLYYSSCIEPTTQKFVVSV